MQRGGGGGGGGKAGGGGGLRETPSPPVYPREADPKARLPVQQKPHCAAPAGVVDPVTTLAQRLFAPTQEMDGAGFPQIPAHNGARKFLEWSFAVACGSRCGVWRQREGRIA